MKAPDLKLLKKSNLAFKRKTVLEHDMFYSMAFTSLSKTSMYVLLRFLQKRTWYSKDKKKNRTYQDKGLVFTHGEAELLGISEASFRRSIKELIEKGFVSIAHQGGQFGNGRDYSRYDLIEDWRQYGTKEFKPREKARVVSFSSGFKAYNDKRKKNN
jgi:predicted transcriptional regulator